jgi:hypothetical protein
VIVEKTEIPPFVPVEYAEFTPPGPPAPIVTVYGIPALIVNADSAAAPPPDDSVMTLDL